MVYVYSFSKESEDFTGVDNRPGGTRIDYFVSRMASYQKREPSDDQ
jgi:hypothetical protein